MSVDPPADPTFTVGVAVSFELPEPDAGDSPFTFTLTGPAGGSLPDGLSFNVNNPQNLEAPRILSGIPTTAAGPVELTYTITDTAGDSDSTTFMVTINPPPWLCPR